MKHFLIIFFVVATTALVAGKSYCEMPCKDFQSGRMVKHIGCNHNKEFNRAQCPEYAKMVPITDSLKQILVDAHNEKRNEIAGGGDPNHKPACRMATMEWDDELAELAALNVRQCKMNHDKCRNTNAFQYSGQNLAYIRKTPVDDFNAEEQLLAAVNNWFAEVENSTQKYIDSYPLNGPKIGHFTVMMADRNIRVGCGAATYNEKGGRTFLTACNYATTNMIDHPIYESCKTAGEKCETKTNKKYTNLCSVKETYAVNEWVASDRKHISGPNSNSNRNFVQSRGKYYTSNQKVPNFYKNGNFVPYYIPEKNPHQNYDKYYTSNQKVVNFHPNRNVVHYYIAQKNPNQSGNSRIMNWN